MKKYRLELSIGLILASLLVLLLWSNLAAVAPQLPIGLLAACLVGLISVIAPWPERDSEGRVVSSPTERYAPKEFALAAVWSVLGIVIIIGVATLLNRDRFSKTFDLTQRKVNSLSTETLNVLKELKTDVQIVCIPSQNQQERYCDESTQLRRLFAENSPKIQHFALSLDDPEAFQQVRPGGYSRLVLLTKDKARNEVVGAVTESKLTNALLNLTKSKRAVYFLTGNGEHETSMEGGRNFFNVAEILRNRNYEVIPHKITEELPAQAQLVIAGPAQGPYTQLVENSLRRFLARGGRLIFVVNPYREPGMPKLFADLGVRLDSSVLINNRGATQFGAQLAQLDPMRPPIIIGEFSRNSPVTSPFRTTDVGLADGARAMSFAAPASTDANALKVKGTELMSAIHSAPVTLTEDQRNRLPLEGDLALKPNAGFDPNKTYTVALDLEIENPAKLAEGLPSATLASKDSVANVGLESGTTPDSADKSKSDAATPAASADKAPAGVVVLGFDPVAFERIQLVTTNIMPIAVAHLYKDRDLISIPNKDFAPKRFKLERNPGNFVLLFAFILPLLTALAGLYIYVRRRSA
ncbi:MAG: hypothetical protein FJY29_02090 [Betaproteobacteria bacterium]|nr:hypothetical protein [Betaproteobacteria bacterium]